LGLFTATFGYSDPDANEIVKSADLIRAPKNSYLLEAVVTNYEDDREKAKNSYKVYVKDLNHVLVEFVSPASEKGKSLLVLNEDLWIYLPRIKKPTRIPMQNRLSGEVSNGDVTRLNFSHDYDATLAAEENVNGQDAFVLDLIAKSRNKTYPLIKYWVSKNDFMPLKSEYFTASGKSLKTCTFEGLEEAAGRVRPMRLIYQDSILKNKKSILELKSMTEKKFDDKMFTKDHLKILE
jgi:outer membrane lipoprotein-sorting protein